MEFVGRFPQCPAARFELLELENRSQQQARHSNCAGNCSARDRQLSAEKVVIIPQRLAPTRRFIGDWAQVFAARGVIKLRLYRFYLARIYLLHCLCCVCFPALLLYR